MKKFKKKHYIIAVIITISISLLIYGGVTVSKNTKKENTLATTEGMEVEEIMEQIDSEPDIEAEEEMSEGQIINMMHKMTHQKVIADEKWGAIPMTKENIDNLVKVLENGDYDSRLLRMAKKWQEGDFNSIVSDHNTLWTMQDGTIGRATRKATEEEEKEFIAEHFDVKPAE